MKGETWRWLFLLSGIGGSLLLLQSAEGMLWNHWGEYLSEAGILISLWIFFEILMKWHWPAFVCVTVLMLGSALAGMDWKISTLFFMVIFQFSFWMLHNLKKTSGSLQLHALGWISLIIPAAFFLAAVLLARWNTDWFYQAVYQAEGAVRRNIKRASGVSENFADGVINRGNIYPAGIEEFRVRVNQEPSEDMYLKDFTGGTYSNGKWERADDAVLFERMNRNTLHWEQWEGWIENLYESLYFAMNRSAGNLSRAESRTLFIEYNKNSAGNWYEPYYSRWDKNFWNSDHYAEYKLEYFEQGEIEISWDDVNRYFETARDWYREVQDAYMKEAKAVYTEVPQEELPGLFSLCDGHPMESPERAAEFICGYLQENVSYTQRPGMIPFHAEPVEYFLFEKKEGYCQHFASAAVLMFRLYGIPARYAAGYRITQSDFEYQEDGTWHAVVTDQSAHAWPEIFVEDHGWIPVEVTVDMGNHVVQEEEGNGQQAGLPENPVSGLLSRDDSGVQIGQEEERNPQSDTRLSGSDIRFSKGAVRVFAWCMTVLLISAVFGLAAWNYRVKWVWMRKGGSRRIYGRLLHMIHFAGYLKEYDGSEKAFSKKLAATFPAVSYEEAERLTGIVNEEAFGRPGSVNPEKISFAEEIYRRISRAAFTTLPIYKRIWF